MWVIVRDGKVVSVQKTDPGQMQPGNEAFEWFGPEPKTHIPELVYPDGTVRPGREADDDPRPPGYTDNWDSMITLRDIADSEIDWLNTTIPTIGSMNVSQALATIERLARENRALIKALKYLIAKSRVVE